MATLQSGKLLLSHLYLECVAGLNERKGCIFTNDMKLTRQNMKYFVFILSAIQVKVNLEITTFFFYLRFPYCPKFFWFGVVFWTHVRAGLLILKKYSLMLKPRMHLAAFLYLVVWASRAPEWSPWRGRCQCPGRSWSPGSWTWRAGGTETCGCTWAPWPCVRCRWASCSSAS